MSYTLNKIIDSIVYDNRYPTHQEIIDWAEQAKPFSEYEKIIEGMEEHNLCTVSYKVDNVYKRNFYPSTLNGATVIMETGNTLWSQNEKRKVDIKDLKGIEFSKIVAQRYPAEIAARFLMKEEKRIKEEQQEQERIQTRNAELKREGEWRAECYRAEMLQKSRPKTPLEFELELDSYKHKMMLKDADYSLKLTTIPWRQLHLEEWKKNHPEGIMSISQEKVKMDSTPKVDTALLKPENTNKESSCTIL